MTDLVKDVISNCIRSQYIYSKVQFDNAKDTTALLAAANENANLLLKAVEQKISSRIEQMMVERIEKVRDDGEWIVKINDTLYKISEY